MGIKFNPLTGQFDLVGSGGGSGGPAIGQPVTGADPNAVLVTDNTGNLEDSGTLTDGQIVIGRTGQPPIAGNLSGTAGEIIVTPGSGTLTVALSNNINANKIADGSVDNTEFQSLNGVTSNIQTQLDGKANTALSNLTTTSINQNLLPDTNNTRNIGASGNNWLNSYVYTTRTDIIGTTTGAGIVSFANQIDAGAMRISSVDVPLLGADAANKNYVDNADALLIPQSDKGIPGGVATLDGTGKVPVTQLPSAIMTYEGLWNASTNTPTLADGVGDTGMVYRVSVAGTQDLGSGPQTYMVGDYVIYNGSIWEKSDTTDAVISVNGQQGVVVLDAADIGYDNSTSLLAATEVQAALDEIVDRLRMGDVQAIYVDQTEGDDINGTGSSMYPVATLNKAVTLVTNPMERYVIKLGPGTYSGATVAWPANADLQGSGANSTSVQNPITYIAAAASDTGFTMSLVSANDITLDFTLASVAIPMFFDGTFTIERLDTLAAGPWAVRVNDATLGACVFRGNNLISNCLFTDNFTVEEDGVLYSSDSIIGVQVDLIGNAQLGLNGSTVPDTIVGTTVGPNTPIVNTDASSIAIATLTNVNVVLSDKSQYVDYDNTTSGLTAENVQDAIDELASVSVNAANQSLSNLTNPTSVNQSLVPSIANFWRLGSTTAPWDRVYARIMRADDTSAAVRPVTADLLDASNNPTLNWTDHQLLTNGTVKLDWTGTDLDINTRKIVNVVDPTSSQDVATKAYVDGAISSGSTWQKFTISHTALQAAATTNSITLLTMTDRVIEGVIVAHSTAASGGTISAYDLTVGILGEEDRFATVYDAFVAPTSTNHNIYHVLDIPERGNAVNVLLTATATGDNLDQSVAGTFIIYVKTSSIE